MLDGFAHPFLAGGHTHVPLVRRFHDQTIINPGSVGLPFTTYGSAGEVPVMNHAAYAIVERLEQALLLKPVKCRLTETNWLTLCIRATCRVETGGSTSDHRTLTDNSDDERSTPPTNNAERP